MHKIRASLGTQQVKNPPAMRETEVRSLGREDPLEEGMASHSSVLAWRTPVDRGAWQAIVHRDAQSQTRPKWLSCSSSFLAGFVFLFVFLTNKFEYKETGS